MAQGKFHFTQALLPQGWARDVAVETDAAGIVLSVRTDVPGASPGVLLDTVNFDNLLFPS